jgi:hypothetical protein
MIGSGQKAQSAACCQLASGGWLSASHNPAESPWLKVAIEIDCCQPIGQYFPEVAAIQA